MKRVLISILTLFMVATMITTVNAATANINVGASSDTVIKGKTFTVTVAGTADNNITALQANLTYDSSKIAIESKAAGTGFSDVSGSGEIAIASTSPDSLSKSGTLYTITFKVLDNAEEGETTITISNATLALVNANNAQEDVSAGSGSVTIKIKKDDTTVGNQGGTQETPKQEDTTGNKAETQETPKEDKKNTTGGSSSKGNTSGNKSTNKSSSTKKNTTTKLPQTGVESFSVIAIIALGAIAIASYVSYRKYKNI